MNLADQKRWPSTLTIALALTVLVIGALACASPRPPGGGPGNTVPPILEKSTPAADSVNVPLDTDIVLRFDKYVSRGTVARAFSMTPEPDQRPEFSFSGRSITITFPEPLRDSTTYIVSFDTDLRAERGNVNLDEPLTFAFATGPRIDQGRIEGTIVAPQWGTPEQGVDIFAYALSPDATTPPDSLPEEPDFRTQSGSDGTFTFRNIREEPYYVIGVRDDNRNRFPDANEAYAVPPIPIIEARENATEVPIPWLLTDPRPAPPRAQRIRARSERRQNVRFNRPISWIDRTPGSWVLVDSVAQDTIGIRSVYTDHDTPFEVGIEAERALRPEQVHRLTIPANALADSLDRVVPDTTLAFTPSTAEDTRRPEFIAFRPDRPGGEEGRALTQDEAPRLRTTLPLSDDVWNDGITAADTTGTPRTISPESSEGLRYTLNIDPPLDPDMPIDIRIEDGVLSEEDTVFTQRFRRLTREELGEIEAPIEYEERRWPAPEEVPDEPAFQPITRGIALPTSLLDTLALGEPDTESPQTEQDTLDIQPETPLDPETLSDTPSLSGVLRIEFHDESRNNWPVRRIRSDTTGVVQINRVPEGEYRIRLYIDRRDTGRWSPGRLMPYEPADPITWSQQSVEGRARWTNVLDTPLRIIQLTD